MTRRASPRLKRRAFVFAITASATAFMAIESVKAGQIGPLMVHGLHSDDMLVVRDAPDVLGKALGWIAYDTHDVVVLEVSADGASGRVSREGLDGWVQMHFLKPAH
jgi:hypothetical protein